MIQNGSKVTLHYTLTVDGKVIESTKDDEALSYTHGEGEIIPGLEEELAGLFAGDSKTASIPPDKAYGARSDDLIQTVPRDAFSEADDLKVGDAVQGEAGEQPFQARVTEVLDGAIVLDLNHPLADKTLEFAVEIVEVG